MTKPENFILNTDYATLKNDSDDVYITLTVPGSINIGEGNSYSQYVDGVVGTKGAINQITIKHSGYPSNSEYVTQALSYYQNGTISGNTVVYTMLVETFRVSANTVRLRIFIYNSPGFGIGGTLVTEPTQRTIICKVSTFLSPFA